MIRRFLSASVLLVSALLPAAAVEEDLPGPITVRLGWSYLASSAREIAGKNGLLLGVGLQDDEQGLLGRRGVEALLRTAHSADGRVDDLGALYVERMPLQNQVYWGLGAGLWGLRIHDQRDDGSGVTWAARPGAEALVGYQFQPPSDDVRLALEIAAIGVMRVNDVSTSGFAASLVAGF